MSDEKQQEDDSEDVPPPKLFPYPIRTPADERDVLGERYREWLKEIQL